MSLDIMMQRSNSSGLIPFDRAILAEILGSHVEINAIGEISGARFSDQDWGTFWGAEEEEISSFSFHGGGEKFMQAMWELADRTQSYIFWPEPDDRPHLLVTSDKSLSELDPGVSDAIGPAIVVRNGEELWTAIFGGDE